MGPVQQSRPPDRAHDLHVLDRPGHGLGQVAHLARGVVEHADGDELAGIEGLGDGLLDGVGEALLADVDERVLVVGERAEVGALAGGESIGHERGALVQQ
jgi:hypothetical protein